MKKYKSSKNVSFEGSGSANLNLSSVKESTAIAMGHNRNVKVSGISFKNMNGGSFITIAGSKKVSINACSFSGYKSVSGVANRYAIKLEVPDKKTKAFPYTWSNPDNTTNTGISIKNSSFNNLASAIGSSKYTDKVYQTSISITKNTFTNLSNNAIRVLNWTTPSITSNSFSNIANGTGSFSGVLVSGC